MFRLRSESVDNWRQKCGHVVTYSADRWLQGAENRLSAGQRAKLVRGHEFQSVCLVKVGLNT